MHYCKGIVLYWLLCPYSHLLIPWELLSRVPLPSLSVEGSGELHVHVIPQTCGVEREQQQVGQHQKLETDILSCHGHLEIKPQENVEFFMVIPH